MFAAEQLRRLAGGSPPSFDELDARYRRQSAGQPPNGSRGRPNWTVH